MNRIATLVCLVLACISTGFKDADEYKFAFIERFYPVALEEMKRTNIPASVKLAQAIVETDFGTSRLSQSTNNYFGIKCKSTWQGPTFQMEDDDRDKNGNLIKSCFRVYDSAEASFIDHSEFLRGRSYYSGLFKLDVSDYKAWALGIKACGYATNPKYAERLIETIETYELYRYDVRQIQPSVETVQSLIIESQINKLETQK